jgi:hypothetical protein
MAMAFDQRNDRAQRRDQRHRPVHPGPEHFQRRTGGILQHLVAAVQPDNAAAIERGEIEAAPSDAAFIEKASGIKSRFVMDKAGILDPQRMKPRLA